MCCSSCSFTLPPEQSWITTYSQIGSFSGKAVGVYRTGLFVLALIVFIYGIDDYLNDDFPFFWIYLTHWGATLELLYFLMLLVTTWLAVVASAPAETADKTSQSTPILVSITWFLGTSLPSVTLLIVVLFWALVFEGGTIQLQSVILHGGNYIVVLLDLLSTRQPFYLRHVYAPLFLATLYALFTYIYHLADGENEFGNPYIYSAIDFADSPGSTTVTLALAVCVGVPLTYLLHYLLLLVVRCSTCSAQADNTGLKSPKAHPIGAPNNAAESA